MTLRKIGRRAFLTGAGATALTLPLLRSLSTAEAAPGDHPQRLVIIYHGLGTLMDQWRPSTTGPGYTLPPMLAPLARHQNEMLVLSGIDNMAGDLQPNSHTAGAHSMLTASPVETFIRPDGSFSEYTGEDSLPELPPIGPSVDQLIADHISTGPGLRRSVHLGVGHGHPGEYSAFWRDDGLGSMQYISNEADPRAAFGSLFGNVTFPEQAVLTPRQRMRQHTGSILDSVLSGFRDLESRLPAEDRIALQRHANQIREVERNLNIEIQVSNTCSRPEINLPEGFIFYEDPWAPVSASNQMDLLTMSLACDITRVATLQFTGLHGRRFSDVPNYQIPAPGFNDWHDMVHNDPDEFGTVRDLGDGLFRGYEWFSHQVASFIDRLKATPEGDGTLLDNTLVLWISEFSDGGGHDMVDLPIVLFGDLQGTLRTGEHIDCSGHSTNELFISLLRAFGRNDSTFGWTQGRNGARFDQNPINLTV